MCFEHPAEYPSPFVRECVVFTLHFAFRVKTIDEKMRKKNHWILLKDFHKDFDWSLDSLLGTIYYSIVLLVINDSDVTLFNLYLVVNYPVVADCDRQKTLSQVR